MNLSNNNFKPGNDFKRAKPFLGTVVEISISAIDGAGGLQSTTVAFDEVRRLEKIFNFFDPESEVSRINQNAWLGGRSGLGPGVGAGQKAFALSPELNELLQLGLQIEKESDGAFRFCRHGTCSFNAAPDSHVLESCFDLSHGQITKRTPLCKIDLGGIAKGFVVDRAFEKLYPLFEKHLVIVNAGGDLRTSGKTLVEMRIPPRDESDGQNNESPHRNSSAEKRFELKVPAPSALATSFWRGQPSVGVASASYSQSAMASKYSGISVMAETCAVADAMTKAMMFGKGASAFAKNLRIREVWFH